MTAPQTNRPRRAVTDEERSIFERDGVVRLTGIYPTAWVDHLERQLSDVFDGRNDRAMEQRSVSGASSAGEESDRFPVVWPRPGGR